MKRRPLINRSADTPQQDGEQSVAKRQSPLARWCRKTGRTALAAMVITAAVLPLKADTVNPLQKKPWSQSVGAVKQQVEHTIEVSPGVYAQGEGKFLFETANDVSVLKQTAAGKAIFDKLAALNKEKGYKVLIRHVENFEEGATALDAVAQAGGFPGASPICVLDRCMNGFGTSYTKIFYDPAKGYVARFKTGDGAHKAVASPSHTVLAHELDHAIDFGRGTFDPKTVEIATVDGDKDIYLTEEHETVGIGPASCRPGDYATSENAVREDLGEQRRTAYLATGPMKIVDEPSGYRGIDIRNVNDPYVKALIAYRKETGAAIAPFLKPRDEARTADTSSRTGPGCRQFAALSAPKP